jgi:hypothetical protein
VNVQEHDGYSTPPLGYEAPLLFGIRDLKVVDGFLDRGLLIGCLDNADAQRVCREVGKCPNCKILFWGQFFRNDRSSTTH